METLLQKIKYKGKGTPHERTAKSRGKIGILEINKILRSPSKLSASYALKIVRCLYIYEDLMNIPKYSLDKALVSLCFKIFDIEIYTEIEARLFMHLCKIQNIDLNNKSIKLSNLLETNCDDELLDEIIIGYFSINYKYFDDKRILGKLCVMKEDVKLKVIKKLGIKEEAYNNESELIMSSLEYKIKAIKNKMMHKSCFNNYKFDRSKFELVDKKDKEYAIKNYTLVSYFYELPEITCVPHYLVRKNFTLSIFNSSDWNNFIEVEVNSCNDILRVKYSEISDISFIDKKKLCFFLFMNKLYNINFIKSCINNFTSFEKFYAMGYLNLVLGEYKTSIENFKKSLVLCINLKLKSIPEIVLNIYNLISLAHLFNGDYFECMYYLDKSISSAERSGIEFISFYFIQCKLIVDRFSKYPGPTSYLNLINPLVKNDSPIEINNNELQSKELIINDNPITIKYNNNELQSKEIITEDIIKKDRLSTNIILDKNLTTTRELRTYDDFSTLYNFNLIVNRVISYYSSFNIISIYNINDALYINNFKDFVKIDINFNSVLNNLRLIINKSKEILKRKVENDNTKRKWWDDRYALDRELGVLISYVNKAIYHTCKFITRHKSSYILILDEGTTEFPFEAMDIFKNKSIYRVPSLNYLDVNTRNCNIESIYYVLDPQDNLKSTKDVIGKYLKSKNILNGVTGCMPSKVDECLDMFLYFGHGSGIKDLDYLDKYKLMMLFGCSSAKLLCKKNFRRNGIILKYLKNSTIVGCLWEVTDKDLDRFSIEVLERIFKQQNCIGNIVSNCRPSFRMKYLNGAAIVVYGAPKIYNFNLSTK